VDMEFAGIEGCRLPCQLQWIPGCYSGINDIDQRMKLVQCVFKKKRVELTGLTTWTCNFWFGLILDPDKGKVIELRWATQPRMPSDRERRARSFIWATPRYSENVAKQSKRAYFGSLGSYMHAHCEIHIQGNVLIIRSEWSNVASPMNHFFCALDAHICGTGHGFRPAQIHGFIEVPKVMEGVGWHLLNNDMQHVHGVKAAIWESGSNHPTRKLY
jgi:hypothetical protein